LKAKGNEDKLQQLRKFEIKIAEFDTKKTVPLPSLNNTETM